jgi:hypothetical protein
VVVAPTPDQPPPAAPIVVVQPPPPTNMVPWVIGGVVVLAGLYLITQRR